jgi:proteasome lid subunit RPN8/RPN11
LHVFLSEKAFIGLVLSSIEVYRNECLGSLLGYNLRNRIVVDFAIPYQTAKRKYTQVEPNWHRESNVQQILPQLLHLKHVGYFHSHTQLRNSRGTPELSEADIESMEPTHIELIIAVNDAKRKVQWYQSRKELRGTIGKYNLHLACYYKSKKGQIRRYRLLCPYVLGFDWTFESNSG